MITKKIISVIIIPFYFIGLVGSVQAQSFNKKALLEFAKNENQKSKTAVSRLPLIYEPTNLSAAQSVNNDQIWSSGITGLNLSGSEIIIGYWDANQPRLSHQEYSSRVSFEDSESGINNGHATQMVGTMVATGVNSDARGMANDATVRSYNWNNDLAEIATEAASNLTLSSHPYIETAGWTTNTSICDPSSESPDINWMWFSLESEDTTKAYQFGYYDSQAQKWDSVAYIAPNYLMVKAAGNQRGEGPSTQPITHWKYDSDLNCIEDSTTVRELDGGSLGYESINAASLAKNVLIVGAVESSSNNFKDLNSISPTINSGFGPTDDGRIKPDIVAPTNVYTSNYVADNSYSTGGGTSAATAVVTGSIALLREHYQSMNSDTLSSASIRALIAQTANDIGNEGPDYKTGWGLLNTERGARFLSSNASNSSKSFIIDTVLISGNSIQFSYEHNSNRPLIFTIAWTDPAGTPTLNANDPTDTLLVNDLDLLILDPHSNIYEPWKLDPNNPENPATTGNNDVDNIEQIRITNAESGLYSITISHEGNLQSGSQRVSILAGEAEPEIEYETISSGNWSSGSTWLGGIAPSNSLQRAKLKHAVTLDKPIIIRGVTFDGGSAELILNGKSIDLYGGVTHISGGLGFSGDNSSSVSIFDWDSNSDFLKFRNGFQKLDFLMISTETDSIVLSSNLSIYSKLTLESGVLDASSATVKLISDSIKTAWIEKKTGSISGNLTYSRLYSEENSGWRMLSSPVQNELFSTLSDSFHTQGGTWADFSVSDNESSLWLFDTSIQSFVGQAGADSSLTSGEGYLFYMFDEDQGSTQLPTFLEFTGNEPDSIIRDLYRGTHDSLSYNLVGNPFIGILDWYEVVNDGANLGTSYAIWDPSETEEGGSSGFKYYNSSTEIGDAGRYIAPMQGFFVHSTSENAKISFRQDQKRESSPNKYGKSNTTPIPFIRFKLLNESQSLLDDQGLISFSENSHSGTDEADVLRMKSLDGMSNQIRFQGEDNEQRVFEGRSSLIEFDEVEMIIQTTNKGKFILNWGEWNHIPKDWKLELVDISTGYKIDMNNQTEYLFLSDGDTKRDELRFRITVQRNLLIDSETESPIRYELLHNFPNPFNPTTNISYSIPRAGNVKIEVFNTLGQRVTVLVDEQKSAGSHSIKFNATQLSSGVYFYRIEAGDFNQIKSMVLIK